MGSFANSVFNILIGWFSGVVASVWSALSSPGGTSFLQWIGDRWIMIAVIICIAGIAADVLIYVVRWRPHRVWASFFRRISGKTDGFDEVPRTEAGSPETAAFSPVKQEGSEAAGGCVYVDEYADTGSGEPVRDTYIGDERSAYTESVYDEYRRPRSHVYFRSENANDGYSQLPEDEASYADRQDTVTVRANAGYYDAHEETSADRQSGSTADTTLYRRPGQRRRSRSERYYEQDRQTAEYAADGGKYPVRWKVSSDEYGNERV